MFTCDGCGNKDEVITVHCQGCRLLVRKSVEQPVDVMPIPYKIVHSDGNATYIFGEK